MQNTGSSDAFDVVVTDTLPLAKYSAVTEVTTPADFLFITQTVTTNTVVRYTGPTIPAGQSRTFLFDVTLASGVVGGETLVNIATVNQATTLPGPVSGERNEPGVNASANLPVIAPAMQIVKSASVAQALPGTEVLYTYRVTNTGDAPLHAVVLTDNWCTPLTLITVDGNGLLDPAEVWVYTCVHVVESSDPDPLVNTATVNGLDPLGLPVQATTQATVRVLAQIAGGVYGDPAGNGTGTNGLSGVEIRLSNGLVTTTDARGIYTFTVLAGSYTITEINPSGYLSTADIDGVNDDRISVALASGQILQNLNFWDKLLGAIGDTIWYDANQNGLQESGKPGISGVLVRLTEPGGGVRTAVTDGDGHYLFAGVLGGVYTVAVDGSTLPTAAFVPTSGPQSQLSPLTVNLALGQDYRNADFGYVVPSSIQVTKRLDGVSPMRLGEPLHYTILITNTGASWVTNLPLQDLYDSRLIRFESAIPAITDLRNDGQLDWPDLTADLGDLAPGAGLAVHLTFSSLRDTGQAPNGVAVNTALVAGALGDPDGPGGSLGSLQPLATQQSAVSVVIQGPTAAALAQGGVARTVSGVTIHWQTASEVNMVGFNLLRRSQDGVSQPINQDLILAEQAGLDRGSAYTVLDSDLLPGQSSLYVLEIVAPDGHTTQVELGLASGNWRLFLPVVIGPQT